MFAPAAEWLAPPTLQAASWVLSWEGDGVRIACMLLYGLVAFGMSCAFDADSSVRRVQELLKFKGYYKGTVDGEHGPLTRAALTSYQEAQGLPATGRLGCRTVQRLTSSARSTARQTTRQASAS